MPITQGTSGNHAARSNGFTLIELLAVMLILGILITLVVGSARIIFVKVYTEETKTSMKIIMTAVREYYKAKAARPEDNYPDLSNSNWVNELAKAKESRVLIGKLAETVWSADNKTEFRDAWGNKIKYEPEGGRAGAPGLISGGPDGDTTTKDDNVRYNR